MRRDLSSTARRVLVTVQAEGIAAIDDLEAVLGMARPVLEDALGELHDAGEIRFAVAMGREVVTATSDEGEAA